MGALIFVKVFIILLLYWKQENAYKVLKAFAVIQLWKKVKAFLQLINTALFIALKLKDSSLSLPVACRHVQAV